MLTGLRGLRSAPPLSPELRRCLRRELEAAMGACRWFTIGVMAASSEEALRVLRLCEGSWGWTPLQPADAAAGLGSSSERDPEAGPVFLKGNQRTGLYTMRREPGIGEGLLISGHDAEDPCADDTWGPLPLDLWS